MLSGNYVSLNAAQSGFPDFDPVNPWTYLFAIGHPNQIYGDNLQLQIATSRAENDRVFFRKIERYKNWTGFPGWNEFATRGANTFNGLQTINGSIFLPIYNGFYIGNNGSSGNRMRLDLNDAAVFFDYYPQLCIRTGNGTESTVMQMLSNGNVGIGTTNPGVKLDVAGTVRAHEVRVCLNQGCDYVFGDDYKLMNLTDLSNFVKTNKHLPEVTPAAQMENEGINLSEMNALLLKKVEELTLYMIQQNQKIENLENKIKLLENK